MRCPKCHYISFEAADRCRNCGYELSLASDVPDHTTELPLNDREADPLPPVDLSLSQVEGLHEAGVAEKAARFDIDAIGTPAPIDLPLFTAHGGPAAVAKPVSARPATETPPAPQSAAARIAAGRRLEAAAAEDAPLVRPSAVPRPPIAVRRATPDAQRLRARYGRPEPPRLDLQSPDEDVAPIETEAFAAPDAAQTLPAPPARRVLAGLIDALIVGAMNVGVLYFTLKLCELPLSAAGVLEMPTLPLAGFLLMLDAGYVVTFTAVVGQTIGKMATGLRVVHLTKSGEDDGQPPFGFAMLRTAAYAASLLPVGLGFLPALVAKDRRALHDRLAETRVIRL